MAAEKIIQRIQKDAEKERDEILTEAKKQATEILSEAKKLGQHEANKILTDGKNQSKTIKKILVAKALQDNKRDTVKAREKIIDECFTKAHHELSLLKQNQYEKIVTKLIREGKNKLGKNCRVLVSRDRDKDIVTKEGLKIAGSIEALGGVVFQSEDGKITVDNTFDGILKRKKDEIRIKVGKLLFSELG